MLEEPILHSDDVRNSFLKSGEVFSISCEIDSWNYRLYVYIKFRKKVLRKTIYLASK